MLERRFAEDIYSAGVWPRVVAAVVAAFQSKSGGVVDGRKSEENERPPKEGSKGPRGQTTPRSALARLNFQRGRATHAANLFARTTLDCPFRTSRIATMVI